MLKMRGMKAARKMQKKVRVFLKPFFSVILVL